MFGKKSKKNTSGKTVKDSGSGNKVKKQNSGNKPVKTGRKRAQELSRKKALSILNRDKTKTGVTWKIISATARKKGWVEFPWTVVDSRLVDVKVKSSNGRVLLITFRVFIRGVIETVGEAKRLA